MKYAMKGCFPILALLMALGASAEVREKTIPAFLPVTDGIYRGGRPSEGDLKKLSADGMKTVLDLEDERTAVGLERTVVQDAGMEFINQPMSWAVPPNDSQVDGTLKMLDNPSLRPLFLHCKHGEDRTGMIIGIYRVLYQNWTPGEAHREMVELGFHTSLTALEKYFWKKTASPKKHGTQPLR